MENEINQAHIEQKTDYGASNIQALEGLEAVRKRPGMYIGSTDTKGLHHLVWEVIDNSIDEHLAGHCDTIDTIIHLDNSVSVKDNGRGIPTGMHQKLGKSALEVVMTVLHAGGKFDKDTYKVSGGLHGVGVSCVNALSDLLVAKVEREGKIFTQSYSKGKPITEVQIIGDSDRSGTTITFKPDATIFETTDIKSEVLTGRMRELSFLNKGLTLTLYDERTEKTETFHSEGGLVEFVRYADNNKVLLTERPIYVLGTKDNPEFEKAKVLVPEGKTVIEGFDVTSTYLLVQDKKDVMSRIMVHDLNGAFIKELTLPEFGNVASMSYDRDEDIVYVSISSFTATQKIYKLDGKKLTWEFYYQDEIPMDLTDIHASLEFVESKDGVKIPLFIVHKKDIKKDGNNPVLITGYGGFNIGMSPEFVGYNASFLKRGGIYVRVGLRGGNEYGEAWHLDGMLKKKQHTFDDMIAATEWLITNKYSNSNRIVARGGSNGGLLMGAIATQRPDLYRAIICQVPLLDMIRYHKFRIARYWIPEYGDPDKAEDFGTLLQYSPYHNIKAGVPLPEMLVSVGEFDMRVDPLHGKKFVAIAQSRPEQDKPVMLHVDFDAGHGTGKSIEQTIEDQAFFWRYIFSRLNMN